MRRTSSINAHEELNSFLVDVFRNILRKQAQDVKALGYHDLSINEMHVIEAACVLEQEDKNSARDIAQSLGVTPGTLTAAINVLEKKGYLSRSPDRNDRRRIRVSPTLLGRKAQSEHRIFHKAMIKDVADTLSEEEMQVLLRALKKISTFFTTERKQSE